MSAREENHKALIEKRARALALMLLTRRAELLIEEVKDAIGLDYIVRFHTKGREGLREFGIKVRGSRAAVSKAAADTLVRPALQEVQNHGPFLQPICLFMLTMEDDGAWYAWVAEPITAEDGKPLLRRRDEPDCRQLDKRGLKDLLERIDSWYDAIFPRLVVNGPGRSKADRKAAHE